MSGPELHRGKLARHPRILSVESLTREDLACLREKRVGPPRVKALRRSHHRVARLIALGYKDHEIMRMTGYTPSRIGQLKDDPAVQELISLNDQVIEEDYKDQIAEYNESMISGRLRVMDLIHERLDAATDDNDPQPIALRDLVTLNGDLADRTGFGKHATQTREVKDFAEMMKQLARGSGRSNVIDAKPRVPQLEGPSADEPSDTAALGFKRRA